MTTKGGGGGPDPFVVKDYENGPFFIDPFPYLPFLQFLQQVAAFAAVPHIAPETGVVILHSFCYSGRLGIFQNIYSGRPMRE